MSGAGFAAQVPGHLQRLSDTLDALLPPPQAALAGLPEALRYALQGGKRLRGLLVYAAGQALGQAPVRLDPLAAAVELVHAYSLVHDDLPAMDDDDLRRGQPTVHRRYDEATAILVGDALQALAFEALTAPAVPAAAVPGLVRMLAQAVGAAGMVGGQALDLAAEGQPLSLDQLQRLHALKTGALIRACCLLPALLEPAHEAQRQALQAYGEQIGLAFQIQDDVLDETAETAVLGKTAGKDRAQAKSTYPALMGLQPAQARAAELFDGARAALRPLGPAAEGLHWLADHIQAREA
ncbi:MAG TPA: farnesyl diphosphate synthase [Nevskiaceae bacterium]|nr:farnesyl diphosphate synthase [Nevskiaceae bacterium]